MIRARLATVIAPALALALLPNAAAAQTDAAGAASAGNAGPQRYFTPQDLFHLSAAADPQISPDGSRIAYVRRSNDIMADRA
ncbi:MAG: dipeptidyl aminopeptidase/acylaminoacyl-peptidase family protein, partial [Porphyrobacter sp. HL-46]